MWDERYSRKDYLFGTEPADFLKTHQSLLRPGLAGLAVADGEGRNSVFLAEQGVVTTAFDGSSVAVAKARTLAQARRVSVDYHVAELESWAWDPERFDLVVAVFIQFLGPPAMAKAFENMRRTLRPGGRLLLHGYRPKQLDYGTGGPPEVGNLYTEELLRKAFDGMDLETLIAYDTDLCEGSGHVGRSALIDLVARKR